MKGAALEYELAANLGVGRGENKDILWINLDAHILPLLHANGIVNAGLERTVDSLNVNMHQIDLSEKAA